MKSLRVLLVCLVIGSLPAHAAPPDAVRFGARIELGDVDTARQWLDEGLDPNFVADRIGTGLMIGAWTGNVGMMELFLARGADINRANAYGETALMHAAWKGQTEALQWLLARGARVNSKSNEWSALHYAAFAGHGAAAEALLARGADINATSPNGSSVLMMAVYEGQEGMARMLVERGANRSIRNERGDSALDWAIKFNRSEIARLVGSAGEVAAAASQPRNAPVARSQWEPDSVEELMRIRRILESRGISLQVIDQRLAAMRAQIARAGSYARQPRSPVLEITARRGAPAEQTMELIYR
jgi:hypothetical protein